jgi:hypothetical protein
MVLKMKHLFGLYSVHLWTGVSILGVFCAALFPSLPLRATTQIEMRSVQRPPARAKHAHGRLPCRIVVVAITPTLLSQCKRYSRDIFLKTFIQLARLSCVTDRQRIKLISQAPAQRQVRAPSPATNLLLLFFKKGTGPEKDWKEKRENSTGAAQRRDATATEIVGNLLAGMAAAGLPPKLFPRERDENSSVSTRPAVSGGCNCNCGGCSAWNRLILAPLPMLLWLFWTLAERQALIPNLTESTNSLHTVSSKRENDHEIPIKHLIWAVLPTAQHVSLQEEAGVMSKSEAHAIAIARRWAVGTSGREDMQCGRWTGRAHVMKRNFVADVGTRHYSAEEKKKVTRLTGEDKGRGRLTSSCRTIISTPALRYWREENIRHE